jgi:DNA-binding MarR family transcriptional regulator
MKKSKYDKKIIERREKVQKRKLFTLVPIEIAEDKSLKLNEKFILSEITTMQVYAREFHATNQYLADLLGLSRSSISRIINDLRNRGYIRSYQYYDPVDKFTYKRILHANVFLDCEVFKSNKKLKIFDQED